MGVGVGLGAIGTAIGTAASSIGTAGAIGLGATALSAGVGAYSAISSSQAQSANAKYQAQVASNNAITANNNATLANQQAGAKAQSDYRTTAIKLGAQRAAMGADGGALDSGSNLGIQRDTAQSGALQVSQDVYNGQLQAYGLRAQAGNYTAQSQLDTAEAGQAGTAGMIGAGSSILSGASQFASKWNQYYTPTAPASGTYGGGQINVGPGGLAGGGV